MPEFTQALSAADADRRAGVCPDSERGVDAQVVQERLVPKALAGSTNDSIELSFS